MAPNRKSTARTTAGRKKSNRETPPRKTKATLPVIGEPSPTDDPSSTDEIHQVSRGKFQRAVTSKIAQLSPLQIPRQARNFTPPSQTLPQRSP